MKPPEVTEIWNRPVFVARMRQVAGLGCLPSPTIASSCVCVFASTSTSPSGSLIVAVSPLPAPERRATSEKSPPTMIGPGFRIVSSAMPATLPAPYVKPISRDLPGPSGSDFQ